MDTVCSIQQNATGIEMKALFTAWLIALDCFDTNTVPKPEFKMFSGGNAGTAELF